MTDAPKDAPKEPREVTVVVYRWRSWAEDLFVFGTREAAEQNVIANAQEAGIDVDTFDAALNGLTAADHSVTVKTTEVL